MSNGKNGRILIWEIPWKPLGIPDISAIFLAQLLNQKR